MTTVNYRIIKSDVDEVHGDYFQVHEVWYKADGSIEAWTKEPMTPGGETLEGLKRDVTMFVEALKHPVLREEGDTLVEVT